MFKTTWKTNTFCLRREKENSGSFQELCHKMREGRDIREAVFVTSGLLLSLSRICYLLGSGKGQRG